MDTTAQRPATARSTDPRQLDRLLVGAIDLHCHSGPSVMPRYFDHYEAMQEASSVGMRALLVKDHYYSATPVTEMLNAHFQHLKVRMLSGVPLNNTAGGLNIHAVEHGIRLGAKLVWMPTFSARNHLAHQKRDEHFGDRFPGTKKKMLEPVPLSVLDDAGKLLPEVGPILDMIAEHDIVLSSGHLHISEIWPLFDEAKRRGVRRLLCNHPTFVVDATLEDIRQLVAMGVYVEHSFCQFIPGAKYNFFEPKELDVLIRTGTVDRTILGSDVGQVGNVGLSDGFRQVIAMCLDLGYDEASIRKLVSSNAAALMGRDRPWSSRPGARTARGWSPPPSSPASSTIWRALRARRASPRSPGSWASRRRAFTAISARSGSLGWSRRTMRRSATASDGSCSSSASARRCSSICGSSPIPT
jgi:hypothetical protein